MAPLTTRDVLRKHARDGTEVLDGFRGLAIVLVLVYHTWLFSWYTPDAHLFGVTIPLDVFARTGYLGVELFFAISGFVLFFPIVERHFRGGTPTPLRTFAIRRFLKIAPSYAIALIFTAISVRSLHVNVALGPALVEHALLVQNFFSDNFGTANSVFWSLAIEAQFLSRLSGASLDLRAPALPRRRGNGGARARVSLRCRDLLFTRGARQSTAAGIRGYFREWDAVCVRRFTAPR